MSEEGIPINPGGYYTSREAAALLSVSPHTLARWRKSGTGPKFQRINGVIRYPKVSEVSHVG